MNKSKVTTSSVQHAVQLHEMYLKGDSKGCKVDFSGAVLFRHDFSGLNFSRVDFTGASFSYINLSKTNLFKTDLCGVELIKADCIETEFVGSKFMFSTIQYSTFNHVNFKYANLSHSKFLNSNFYHVDFSYTNLSYTNFFHSYFHTTNFTDAIFSPEEMIARERLWELLPPQERRRYQQWGYCVIDGAKFSLNDFVETDGGKFCLEIKSDEDIPISDRVIHRILLWKRSKEEFHNKACYSGASI